MCYEILNLIFTAIGSIATAVAVIITLFHTKLLYLKSIKAIIFDEELKIAPPGSMRNLHIKIINKSNKIINLDDIGIKTKKGILPYNPAELNHTKNGEKFLPYLLSSEDYVTFKYSERFLAIIKDLVDKKMLKRKRRIIFDLCDNVGKKYTFKTKKTAQQYIDLLN